MPWPLQQARNIMKKYFLNLCGMLKKCRPGSVAQYTESIYPAVNSGNKDEYIKIVRSRMAILNNSSRARLKKILKKIEE